MRLQDETIGIKNRSAFRRDMELLCADSVFSVVLLGHMLHSSYQCLYGLQNISRTPVLRASTRHYLLDR